MKNLIKLITIVAVSFFAISGVNAAAPATIKTGGSGASVNYLGMYFPIKYQSNGKVIYCLNFHKDIPKYQTLYKKGANDAGITEIVKNGYPRKSMTGNKNKDYYITAMAIHLYVDRKNGVSDSKNGNMSASAKKKVKSSANSGGIGKYIIKLVNLAEKASYDSGKITITPASRTLTLTSDKKYYTTGNITVSGSKSVESSFKASVSGISGAQFITTSGAVKTSFKLGETFRIRVPVANVKVGSSTLKMSVTGTSSVDKTYRYAAKSSTYQPMTTVYLYPDEKSVTDSDTFNVNKTSVRITKTDITGDRELDGAHLVVKDSKGQVIDQWVSKKGQVHEIIGLTNGGTYTLEETIAPDGYYLSQKITFQVLNGQATNVTMKDQITRVTISKQDITSKKELPGAHLVLKDADGNIVQEWDSTTEPHYIEGLHLGKTYTLEETIAPDGYVLNKEKIEFTIDPSGEVTKIIMYNQITKTSFSKQDITSKKELPGAHLVLRDENGNIVAEWDSTNTPHIIEGLVIGKKYTLEETIAPKGYTLNHEKIEFTLDPSGKMTEVVMYDEALVEVPETAANIPFVVYLLGFGSILGGSGVVYRRVRQH